MKWRLFTFLIVCLMPCIYTLFPRGRFVRPFLLSNQEISLQTHADYIGSRIAFVLLLVLVYSYHQCWIWLIAIVLFIGWLVDYLITYNDPVLYVDLYGLHDTMPNGIFVPVSYMLLMLVIAGVVAFRHWK